LSAAWGLSLQPNWIGAMIHNNSLELIHQLPHIMLRPQNQTMQDESLKPEQTSTEEFFEIVVLGAGMTVS